MTEFHHIPVLFDEVVELLAPRPRQRLVDATVGGAGHAHALGQALGPDGHLVGIDRDPAALQAARDRLGDLDCRVDLVAGTFAQLDDRLRSVGLRPTDPDDPDSGVHRLLADIGVSSHQLDTPERGFSFGEADAPLDMRMGPDTTPAAELLRTLDADTLADALRTGGDVPRSRRLAAAMIEAAAAGELETTGQLAELCVRILPRKPPGRRKIHPATTVFQALRILVNRELDALDALLEAAPRWVRPGGRLAIISFHSGEDRKVKQAFRTWAGRAPRKIDPALRHLPIQVDEPPVLGREITRKPVTASDQELTDNPRARSAKLRVFEFADD